MLVAVLKTYLGLGNSLVDVAVNSFVHTFIVSSAVLLIGYRDIALVVLLVATTVAAVDWGRRSRNLDFRNIDSSASH